MSKIVLITCVLLILINGISGDCPDGNGGFMRPGEKRVVPGKCPPMICGENGRPVWAFCTQMHPKPGCRIEPEDLSKPFPKCCQTEVCG